MMTKTRGSLEMIEGGFPWKWFTSEPRVIDQTVNMFGQKSSAKMVNVTLNERLLVG